MDLNINTEQAAVLQNSQQGKALWSQKVNTKKPSLVYFLVTLFLLIITLFLYDFITGDINADTVFELFLNFGISISAVYGLLIYMYRASSMKYYIYSDHITF